MRDETGGIIRSSSEGGVTATHPSSVINSVLVGPSTSDPFNTIRPDLIPIACCSLFDNRFAFDSSFVRPEAVREFGFLATLRKAHPGAPISIFGHADPVGTDDYNKQLSGRRAEAVFALLTRNVAIWERLFTQPFHGDDWGLRSVQIMLDALLFDPQRFDGVMDKRAREAVQSFQRENGLPQTGNVGPLTRPKLFAAYMDVLCRDKNLKPYKLTKQDFLARGADPRGKGDFQGCSDFNPLLILSQAENESFKRDEDKTKRNAANAPNRRVLLFLFRPGSKVVPAQWPCPRVKEGVAACRARFFSDAEKRHGVQIERREYAKTRDTFACRFYDRFANTSPCERVLASRLQVRVVPEVFTRRGNVMAFVERLDGQPLPEVEAITLGGTEIPSVFSAPDGRIYFLPPDDGDEAVTEGRLTETGQMLELSTEVRYTDDPVPAAKALRRQMAALRQCGAQVVASGRKEGAPEEGISSVLYAVISDGHLRFYKALERFSRAGKAVPGLDTATTPVDQTEIDAALEGFTTEHPAALSAIFATLPAQKAEA